MWRRSFCCAALVLAATTLGAQTAAPGKTSAPATPGETAGRYVPAIMQERTTTVTGCLQKNDGWTLTAATLAGQKDTASYRLVGIGDARLALFEGKRIEATGALPLAAESASRAGSPAKTIAAAPGATASKNLQLFEATAVKEAAAAKDATGTCP